MQQVKHDINSLHQSIIRTLLYYDIFDYPLKANEVRNFMDVKGVAANEVTESLHELVAENILFQFGDYYTMQPHKAHIDRRKKGNALAETLMSLALKRGQLIGKFPFVRGVMASGSLSKGYMDESSDLDFFIITDPGRLWIARTLLVMYKRVFLRNSHKYFCVNYFVDADHLEIEEKNLFTATELVTLIPLYGGEYYGRLHAANKWVRKFLPNHTLRTVAGVPSEDGMMKRVTEKVLGLFFVRFLNKLLMHATLRRWKNAYEKKYSKSDFDIAFKSRKHVSKNHPHNYQRKVTELHALKVQAFAERMNRV